MFRAGEGRVLKFLLCTVPRLGTRLDSHPLGDLVSYKAYVHQRLCGLLSIVSLARRFLGYLPADQPEHDCLCERRVEHVAYPNPQVVGAYLRIRFRSSLWLCVQS